MPGSSVLCCLPEFAQIHVHWVGDATQPSHPLSLSFPPALSLCQHQGLSQWVSSLHPVAKVLEFSFSISPSNEYSGLICFKIDWFDLLAFQGTLKSLLQHHNFKASIFQPLALFMMHWKNHSFDYMIFVCQVISLLFFFFLNVSAFQYAVQVSIPFLPRSKCLLISWLQSPSTVMLESNEIKSATTSALSPSICHEVMGPDAMILVFLWVKTILLFQLFVKFVLILASLLHSFIFAFTSSKFRQTNYRLLFFFDIFSFQLIVKHTSKI